MLYHIMSHITADRDKLVKARKGARIAFALFLMLGAILFLTGILTNFLPTVMYGIVMFAASVLPWLVSKLIENKLKPSMV